MAPSLWSHAWHVIYGPEILDKVMWSSWWRCLSTPFVKGHPQFKFKLHAMSGSWKTGRNFLSEWNFNKLWVVVHFTSWKFSTSWKFGLYFVYFFIANWNFLTKFCSSDLSVNRNILTLLYLKSEASAHAQLRNYSFLHTVWRFYSMVSIGNLYWG